MRRLRLLVALAGAAVGSCTFITDTCACTRVVPFAVIAGAVRTSANAAAPAASVTLEVLPDAPCNAAAPGALNPVIIAASGDGRFRHPVAGGIGQKCFRLFARPAGTATGPTSDTAIVSIEFGTTAAVPDSVEILLRLR